MAANQVDFKILPSDQFSVYSPATRSDKVITYFTLLSKLRGDILSVGQDDDPNDIVSAFYSSVGGTQTLHLVKADGSEVTASVPEPTVGTVTSVDLTASTGISVSGGPITTSGSITVTNTAPDQVVVLTGAGTTSISGTYPSFTITSNDQFVGTVTSVGLTMPAAFSVVNSPVTTSGTLAVTAAGLSSQYIRGDGQLANFPTPGGGGSSVNYYLNGSVSQGTFGGVTYYELSKVPIAGAGTNFTRAHGLGDGYIASFITDANDPDQINIPGGNFTLEFYFNSSSSGGSPAFYGELYKVSVSNVFTLIASGSVNPESITGGTTVDQYYTSIAVPQTALLATDRLAIRVYVIVSGKDITLHTENSNFSEVITTFSTGLNSLNGLSDQVQYFAVGTAGTDFAISSSLDTHTFNLPTASATNRGALSSADWTTFNSKEPALTKGNLTEATSSVLTITGGTGAVIGSGTTIQVSQAGVSASGFLSSTDWNTFNNKQGTITLTTTGSTGAATFISNTLNIPNYADQFVGTVTSVAALTLGTTGTDLSSSVVNSTTTPVITLNVPTASATNRGALSSADWTTFNSKEPALTKGNLTEATSAVLTITGGTGAVIGTGTTIQVAQSGVSTSGFLSSTDWNTFNGKQSTLTFSAPLVNTSGTVSIPAATSLVDGYLSAANFVTFNGKQDALTLTTTGTTGAATLIGATLNIPNYADQFVGTVTSVNMSVPTGFAISGNPITTSGTLAVAFDTGYSLPTNASQTTWNTAYNDSITAFAYNTSTGALTLTQQDAGTLTATVTLQPFTTSNLAEGTNLYYTDTRARLALSAGTGISYDNATGVITNNDRGSSQNIFKNFAVAGQSTIVADTNDDTLTIVAGSGVTLTTNNTTDTLTISASGSGGTVTSVAALTIGTTGTDLSSTVADGTTTPVITLQVPTASAANRGALSSTDWTTFNSKQGAITLTTTGSSGAATFISNTLNIPDYGSALSAYLPLAGGTLTGNLTVNAHIILPQNPVGTTYGNGVVASPTYMISQTAGDNDAIRLYSESAVTNSVSFVLEVNDDIETSGSEWIFRNKKTYGDYAATTPFRISGAGAAFVNGNEVWHAGNITPVPTSRTITINGTSQDLSANRTFTVGTVTSIDLTAGTGITVSGGPITTSGSITVTNNDRGSSQNIFKNIAVAGQSTIVADVNDDTLTVVAGSGVTITTDATTDTITISATGSGGTITGSGTTNYVPKWTSASAIGDSAIYDNAGNVGIGNTSPTAYSGYTTVHIGNASSIGLIKLGTGSSADGPEIFSNATNNITFNTNSTDTRVTILGSNGNVGINTTNPIGKLQIGGTSGNLLTVGTLTNDWAGEVAIGVTNGNGVIISKMNSTNDSNRVLVFYRDDTNGATIIGHTLSGVSSPAGFSIRANNTSYFNGGNIGIGTTSPGSSLTVGTSFATIPGITVDTGNTGNSAFVARKTTSKPAFGLLPWDASVFFSAGIYYDGDAWQHHSNDDNNQLFVLDPVTGVRWYASNNGTGSWNVSANELLWDNSSIWKNLVRSTRAGDSYFTGGNVGIGTTSPIYALDINNTGAATARVRVLANTNYALLQAQNSSGVLYLGVDDSSGGGFSTGAYSRLIWSSGAYPLIFAVNDVERLRITSGGHVNIGGNYTQTSDIFQVTGSSRFNTGTNKNILIKDATHTTLTNLTSALTFSRTDGISDLAAIFGWNNGGVALSGREGIAFATGGSSLYDSTTERMRITSAGNVGIGTTAPAYTLDVQANTTSEPYVQARFLNTNSSGTEYGGILINGTNQAHIRFLTGTSTWGGSGAKQWQIRTGFGSNTDALSIYSWTAGTEVIYFNANSNVGIGTTNPGERLHVVGPSNNWAAHFVSGTSESYFSYGAGYGAYINAGTSASSSTYILELISNGSTRMFVRGDGNVGIGTTAPGQKLQVDGSLLVNTGTSVADYRDIMMGGIGGWSSGESHGIDTVYGGASSPTTFSRIESYFDGTNGKIRFRNLYNASAARTDILMTIQGNGNVGIGTDSPSNKLTVYQGGGVRVTGITSGDWIEMSGDLPGYSANQYPVIKSNGTIHFANNNKYSAFLEGANTYFGILDSTTTTRVFLATSGNTYFTGGNVGIGITAPLSLLHVAGDARVTSGSLGVGVAPNATDGRIDASNDIVAFQTSDRRLKENITPITNALEKVKSLTGVMFDWKEETKSVHGYEGHDVGIIAQDVQAVLPEAVRTNETGYLSVRYEKMIALLIEGMKEQQLQIDELKSKLK